MEFSLQEDLRQFLADDLKRDAALLSAGYQGSAYFYEHMGTRLVIKEAGGGFWSGWFHRLMLRREARVYALLADVDGVPHSPGLLDNRYLVLDFVDGRSLKGERRDLQDKEAFYKKLHKIIADFHAAGVAHGDLKRKDNVLVDQYEQPHVIDFGAAVMRDGGWLDRIMYPLVVRFDFNAWIKVKYDRDFSAISAEDQRWFQPTAIEDVFRLLRRFWRTITFRQTRKRWHRNRRRNRRI
jgi:serine/threonine protein kinase